MLAVPGAPARVRRLYAPLLALIFAHVLFATSASALYITGCEQIDAARFTPRYGDAGLRDVAGNRGPFGPFAWNVSYTQCFDGSRVTKSLAIDFHFDAWLGYTDAQEVAYMARTVSAVESVWNDKFFISDLVNNMLFPAVLDVVTRGPFDQTVRVFSIHDLPRSNMINWNDGLSAALMAHEVGHMLGLFDEYIGGAVERFPNPTLSDDGLMGLGALLPEPVMHARYYAQYLDFMNTLNAGVGHFVLLRVPEPGSLALALLGLLLVSVGKTRASRLEATLQSPVSSR